MENKTKEIPIQLLHFNDTYEIEYTPIFTATLQSKQNDFLKKNYSQNNLKKISCDLIYEHKKVFGKINEKE